MTIPNPEHLFDQADRLATPHAGGAPRQVDLRRAISAAYYGSFHYILRAAADEFIGAAHHTTSRYAMTYRSIDHRTLRELCEETQKITMSRRFRNYWSGTFGADMRGFAGAVAELQDLRISADYDPRKRFTASEARLAITTSRTAMDRFSSAVADERKMFLTMLVFSPR